MANSPYDHHSLLRNCSDRVKARYEGDGYELSLEHRLTPPFDGLVADAVARRAGETVVIEVRPADMGNGTRDRLACLAEIIAKEPGWRLDIVTYEPETTLPAPDRDDSVRRVEEARRVVDVSPDGAVMLLWSAVEGALLRLSKDRDVAPDGPVPPRTLIHDLAIHGVISDNQAAELDDFARRRDAISERCRERRQVCGASRRSSCRDSAAGRSLQSLLGFLFWNKYWEKMPPQDHPERAAEAATELRRRLLLGEHLGRTS